MKTKKDRAYSIQHTRERLWQRYRLCISDDEYETLCKNVKIVNGVLEDLGERKQKIVKIQFKGKLVTFVYGLGCDYVTTALPPK